MGRARGAVLLAGVLVVAVATSASAASAPSPQNRAILAAGVIQRGDVPSGWTAQKQRAAAQLFASQLFRGVTACKPVSTVANSALITIPHRLSDQFSDPTAGTQTTVVSNAAYAFKDLAAAARYVAAFKASTTATCYLKAVQRGVSAAAQGMPATVKVTPLTNLTGVGDDNVGYSVTVSSSAAGQAQTLYDDVIVVRSGRAVLSFNFQNLGAELPVGPSIIREAVNRVAPLAA